MQTKTCKQTTIDPKFVEFSKYKIYHVGSLLHDLVVNLVQVFFFFFFSCLIELCDLEECIQRHIEAISSSFFNCFFNFFLIKVSVAMVYFNYLLVRQLFSPNLNYYFLVLIFSKLVSQLYFKKTHFGPLLFYIYLCQQVGKQWQYICNKLVRQWCVFCPFVNFRANLKPDAMIELPSMVIDCQKWVYFFIFFIIFLGGGGTSFVIFLKAKKLKVGEILEKCIFNECGLIWLNFWGKNCPNKILE